MKSDDGAMRVRTKDCYVCNEAKNVLYRCRYDNLKDWVSLLSFECPKINLCVRRDNEVVIKFYDVLGYEEESAHYWGKRLI